MKITETLYITDREKWRVWLKKNHSKKKEIWLIYYKSHTGNPRIPYDDAVEEALCFGWIDSTVKRIDDERYAQKYTPRNPKSIWSELNISRAKKMIKEKKMTKVGLKLYEDAMKSGRKNARPRVIPQRLGILEDLTRALAKNKKAQENFSRFAPSYQKMYILWILDAKRKETRKKRIDEVVKRSAKNIKPGML
jgi:uncharacterized protein YdeI (YjbR/CyaY-like superfamily)